jgi:hypothetical protein
MSLPENNDQNLDNTNDQHENEERKKVVYKESEDTINETQADNGDSSSISDIGRSDLINTPRRANKPLGSAHEPGTMPGSNNL